MRLFVCEYVTGGGFAGQDIPPGLRQEGEAMVRALVRDLAGIPGLNLLLARDARLPAPDLPGATVPVAPGDDCWRVWAQAAGGADAIWPVAPETGGLLHLLSRLAIASGGTLLGCRPEAVRLCGSKLATADHLARHGIPVVPTRRLTPGAATDLAGTGAGWVVKPDDGAGAEDTFLLDRPALLGRPTAAPPRDWIVQPLVQGDAASLSLLCRDGAASLLSCNRQHVDIRAGRFRCHGWTVGGMEARRERYEPVATAIARAIPGLWGHVGIDLIDTESGPVVLEINPRLTTTYAGLGDATGINPAACVLALAAGGALPAARATRPQDIRLPPE